MKYYLGGVSNKFGISLFESNINGGRRYYSRNILKNSKIYSERKPFDLSFVNLPSNPYIFLIISGILEIIVGLINRKVMCAYYVINLLYILFTEREAYFNKQLKRFHAAEHMIINFYNKNNNGGIKLPSLEELKSYSRFSPFCTSRVTVINLILVIIYILSGLPIFPILLISRLLLLIKQIGFIKLIGYSGYLGQLFNTKIPNDIELYLAIKTLAEFYMRKYPEKSHEIQVQLENYPMIIESVKSQFFKLAAKCNFSEKEMQDYLEYLI